MNREQWLKSKQSDIGTYSNPAKESVEERAVKAKFRADLTKKGTIQGVAGVFGPEDKGCDGYIEEVIKPENGGTFLKLYGCSYLYKGNASERIVNGLQLAKSFLFSTGLKETVKMFWFSLLFKWLFQRRKFIEFFTFVMEEIDWKVTRHYAIIESEYNEFEKEIERAGHIAISGEGLWERPLKLFIRFIKIFFFVDNTYRFRIQDAFEEAYTRNGGKFTIFHVVHILLERETKRGVGFKWKFIEQLAGFILITSPTLKRITQSFFDELDIERIKMDEDDWYFSLRFKSYNFKGISAEIRQKMWEDINKQRKHIFLV